MAKIIAIVDEEIEITANYYKGSEPYWDRGLGVMLPGDPPEMEDITVTILGVDVDYDVLPKALQEKIMIRLEANI